MTSGGKAEAREGSGRLRGLALSHHAGHHPNNRSPDWCSAQSPMSTALQIVKLWASIGLGGAAEVADNGEWFGQGYPPWPGWPITACQMWQHQQSPTSNHTAAAFLESLELKGQGDPSGNQPVARSPRRSGTATIAAIPAIAAIVRWLVPSHLGLVQPASPICSRSSRNGLGPLGCR